MSASELNETRTKDRARQALLGQTKKKIYKTPQAHGKALKKSLTALPNSPRKKSEIVRGLAKSVELQLE